MSAKKTEKINDFCIQTNNSYAAHCVLLKPYVFEELNQMISSELKEVDVLMAKLQKKYKSYSTSKPLTTQIPSFSNIENTVVDYNWLIK